MQHLTTLTNDFPSGMGFSILFLIKSQIVNILGFVGHTVSVAITQLLKTALDYISTSGCASVAIKLY